MPDRDNRPAVSAQRSPHLEIVASAWFGRDDFVAFLEGRGPYQGGIKPATWHQNGDAPDMSDVFITFDHGEGSDYLDVPEDIWAEVQRLAREHGFTDGIVRIKPS